MDLSVKNLEEAMMSDGRDFTTPTRESQQPLIKLSPNTAACLIGRLQEDHTNAVKFKKHDLLENGAIDAADAEESLRMSLNDLTNIYNDCQKNLRDLKTENAHLQEEIQICKNSLSTRMNESHLKVLRLEQELDHKETEILRLRKDKEDFECRIKLLESRYARKVDELSQALSQARQATYSSNDNNADLIIDELKTQLSDLLKAQDFLTKELEERNLMVENFQEVLHIQTLRGDLLSQAFAESLQTWVEISKEVNDLLETYQPSMPTYATDYKILEIDYDVTKEIKQLVNVPALEWSFDKDLPNCNNKCLEETIDVIKHSILDVTAWCKTLITLWVCDIEDDKTALQQGNQEINDLINICYQLKSSLKAAAQVAPKKSENELFDAVRTGRFGSENEIIAVETTNSEMKEAYETKESSCNTSFDFKISEFLLLKEEKVLLNETIRQMSDTINENRLAFEEAVKELNLKISGIMKENAELLNELQRAKDLMEHGEKAQLEVQDTTAEVIKNVKEERRNGTIKTMLEEIPEENYNYPEVVTVKCEAEVLNSSGMTTFMSATDEHSQGEIRDWDQLNALDSFANQFAEYLVKNEVFHPEDEPPRDPSVFYFLLDRYLLLVDTYHNARSDFEKKINELSENTHTSHMKVEALLSQLSQLGDNESTLCDSSATATSMDCDADLDLRNLTACEPAPDATISTSMVADITRDPLEFSKDPLMCTPTPQKKRVSLRKPISTPCVGTRLSNSRIPVSKFVTPAQPANSSIIVSTPNPSNGSFRELASTPVQRILRQEACSTAKKSVKFRSPLLARTAVETENDRLKALLEEKTNVVASLERSVDRGLITLREMEERVAELEHIVSASRVDQEQVEAEFAEKKEALEKGLADVTSQLHELTNKLVVEAINLDSSLEERLRAVAPSQVLTILLDTIIARFMKAQEDEKVLHEKSREEWSLEMEKVVKKYQSLQNDTQSLTDEINRLHTLSTLCQEEKATLEDKVSGLEEDILRLVTDNHQLEHDNVKLVKDFENQLKVLEENVAGKEAHISSLLQDMEQSKHNLRECEYEVKKLTEEKADLEKRVACSTEVESLKLALENSTKEKEKLTLLAETSKSLEVKIAQLETQNSELHKEKESLECSMKEIEAEKKALDDEVKNYSAVMQQITDKFSCGFNSGMSMSLKDKIEYIYGLILRRLEEGEKWCHLAKKLGSYIDQLQDENAKKGVQQNEIENLKINIAEINGQKLDMEINLKVVADRLTKAELDVSQISAILEEKESCLLKQGEELQTLLTAQKALEVEIHSCREDNEKLRNVVKEKEDRLLEYKQQESTLACLNAEKADLDHLLQEKNRIIETMIAEMNLLKDVNVKTEEDLTRVRAALEAHQITKEDVEQSLVELHQRQLDQLREENNQLKNDNMLNKNSLKEQKVLFEQVVAKLSLCNAELEVEKEKHKEAILVVEELRLEVEIWKKKLTLMEEEAEQRHRELQSVCTEKSNVQDLLLSVEAKLLEAENQITTGRSHNQEIESELTALKEELAGNKSLIEKLTAQMETLVEAKDKLTTEKDALSFKIEQMKELRDAFGSKVDDLSSKLEKNNQEMECIKSEKEGLLRKLEELVQSRGALTTEKEDLDLKVEVLNQQLGQVQQEKCGLESEKEVLLREVDLLKHERDVVISEKDELRGEAEELHRAKDQTYSEKLVLIQQLEQLLLTRDGLENEKESLTREVELLRQSRDAASSENVDLIGQLNTLNKVSEDKAALVQQLSNAEIQIAELLEQVDQYKSTEAVILRKLEEKQTSDETAMRLRNELASLEKELSNVKVTSENRIESLNAEIQTLRKDIEMKTDLVNAAEVKCISFNKEVCDLEQAVQNLARDKDHLNSDLMKKGIALDEKEKSLQELAICVKDLENKICQKDEETSQVKDQLAQRAEVISDMNLQMMKLCSTNAELRELLGEIQKTLGLPEEAVLHLTADTSTKLYLRLFRENFDRAEEELKDLKKQNLAMLSEQKRLSVEVEKLTSDKVHFEIKAAELDAFGRSQEEQIHALSGKLARFEASMSRRSRRSDPIGPRRLEKLEEMNKTLHDLLTELLSTIRLPNAAKLRLISQREVEGATKQILDYAAKLADAQNSLESLKEQMKTLDQENQELSDNMEALLKDNSKLELRILELESAPSSSNSCAACMTLRKTLKKKNDELTKMEAKTEELNTKINELDQENDDLSEKVEALLKDNSKLEMKVLEMQNGTLSIKDCVTCSNFKKTISTQENEVSKLKLLCEINEKKVISLESDIQQLKNKCDTLEGTLADKEHQLYRALNSRVRGDEVRMCGASGGLVKEIDQGEKIRSLSKDNNTLKELLRQRAQTIKELQAELKAQCVRSKEARNIEVNNENVMNTNSMNSPIRERNYNLRTRDESAAYKRILRPKSDGIENLRV